MSFKILIISRDKDQAKSIRLMMEGSVDEIFIATESVKAVHILKTVPINTILCVSDKDLENSILALEKTESLIPLIVLNQQSTIVNIDYQNAIFLEPTRINTLKNIIESFKKSFLNTSVS